MYYPYFRAKQYEMLALRSFIQSNANDTITYPILEPVKASFNSLRLLLNAYRDAKKPIGIILNPEVGDMVNKREQIEAELSDYQNVYTPVFIINYLNIETIKKIILDSRYQEVIILAPNPLPGNGDTLIELMSLPTVKTLIIREPIRSLRRRVHEKEKKIVILHDCFNKQERNAKYIDISEELFSEEYWYYSEEGYDGISDYTVLPSAYIEGGRLPYAIAIHLTYQKEKQVQLRHFVSDSNDDDSNIQGKFEEAAKKAVSFCNENHLISQGIKELKNYLLTEHYPGLGALKKISILNHLELVSIIFSLKNKHKNSL